MFASDSQPLPRGWAVRLPSRRPCSSSDAGQISVRLRAPTPVAAAPGCLRWRVRRALSSQRGSWLLPCQPPPSKPLPGPSHPNAMVHDSTSLSQWPCCWQAAFKLLISLLIYFAYSRLVTSLRAGLCAVRAGVNLFYSPCETSLLDNFAQTDAWPQRSHASTL